MNRESKNAPGLRNGNSRGDLQNVQRCGAKTRRNTACLSPGMKNGRCRLHEGLSTGPRTLAGIERIRRANTRHGWRSQAARAERIRIRELIRQSRATLNEFAVIDRASRTRTILRTKNPNEGASYEHES
jgi:hypothetical protein